MIIFADFEATFLLHQTGFKYQSLLVPKLSQSHWYVSTSGCFPASSTIGPLTIKPRARPLPRTESRLSPGLIPNRASVSTGTVIFISPIVSQQYARPSYSMAVPAGIRNSASSGHLSSRPDNCDCLKDSRVAKANPPEVLLPDIRITFSPASKRYSAKDSEGITILPSFPTFDQPNTCFPPFTN